MPKAPVQDPACVCQWPGCSRPLSRSNQSDIDRHMLTHYKKGTPEWYKHTVPCSYCHKRFRQKSQLTTHERKHNGVKLECPTCGILIKDDKEMSVHRQTEHGHNPKSSKRIPIRRVKTDIQNRGSPYPSTIRRSLSVPSNAGSDSCSSSILSSPSTPDLVSDTYEFVSASSSPIERPLTTEPSTREPSVEELFQDAWEAMPASIRESFEMVQSVPSTPLFNFGPAIALSTASADWLSSESLQPCVPPETRPLVPTTPSFDQAWLQNLDLFNLDGY